MAVEAAELGTWRADFGADRFDGSARCRAMPALPAALGPLETWQMAVAGVHPQDRAALAAAVQQCVAAGGGVRAESGSRGVAARRLGLARRPAKLAGGAEQPPSVQGGMDDVTPRAAGSQFG
jgi:hypothetical protein